MILSFELTMPNKGSWDGKWSGEGKPYFIVKGFRNQTEITNAIKILEKGYFHYSWSDGWAAGVHVKQVTSQEAAKLRRITVGFNGYDRMVDSIIKHGEIRT